MVLPPVPRAVLFLAGALVAYPAAAQSFDARFLDGLRERQLFSLAEKFCRDRLARPALPEPRRAELSIELSRCLTEEAWKTCAGKARRDLAAGARRGRSICAALSPESTLGPSTRATRPRATRLG